MTVADWAESFHTLTVVKLLREKLTKHGKNKTKKPHKDSRVNADSALTRHNALNPEIYNTCFCSAKFPTAGGDTREEQTGALLLACCENLSVGSG